MRHSLTGAMASIVLLGTAAQAHEDLTAWRVFVGDHAAPRVTAFDLSDPSEQWTFATAGQVRLYPVAEGSAVAAVQSDSDRVHILSSGIRHSDHGDHADLEVGAPRLLGALAGPRPVHLVVPDGQVAINFDGGGYALLIAEDALRAGRIEQVEFPQARAHHGFVTPFGDTILSTVASEEPVEEGASVPRLGLQAFDRDGTPAGELATCTAIHGEAFSGAYLAAGCREGVLTVTGEGGTLRYRMLPYPADFPDATTGTLLGVRAFQGFLGNHGADGLVVVDPVDEPHLRRIALPFRRVDFALDPAQPTIGYALTEDGTLHRIDLVGAQIAASARVVDPYSMDGHWNDPRPRMAVAGDDIVLTDPRAGLVRLISTETLAETGTITVEGMPYNLTVVGGSGMTH